LPLRTPPILRDSAVIWFCDVFYRRGGGSPRYNQIFRLERVDERPNN